MKFTFGKRKVQPSVSNPEALGDAQEQAAYEVASQWQLMWWKFRKA
jgi:hypothetical protein